MIKNIEIEELVTIEDKSNIIDVREPYELNSGYIEGAKNIPMGILLMDPDNYINKDQTYFIICASGSRSGRTCMMLQNKGYNVVNVSGGMYSYR